MEHVRSLGRQRVHKLGRRIGHALIKYHNPKAVLIRILPFSNLASSYILCAHQPVRLRFRALARNAQVRAICRHGIDQRR